MAKVYVNNLEIITCSALLILIPRPLGIGYGSISSYLFSSTSSKSTTLSCFLFTSNLYLAFSFCSNPIYCDNKANSFLVSLCRVTGSKFKTLPCSFFDSSSGPGFFFHDNKLDQFSVLPFLVVAASPKPCCTLILLLALVSFFFLIRLGLIDFQFYFFGTGGDELFKAASFLAGKKSPITTNNKISTSMLGCLVNEDADKSGLAFVKWGVSVCLQYKTCKFLHDW